MRRVVRLSDVAPRLARAQEKERAAQRLWFGADLNTLVWARHDPDTGFLTVVGIASLAEADAAQNDAETRRLAEATS